MFLLGRNHAMTEKWLSYLNVPRFNRSRTGLIRYPEYFLSLWERIKERVHFILFTPPPLVKERKIK